MTSVSGCGSLSLITNRSAFLGSGLQHRAVFVKPWSSSSLQSRSMVVEAKTKTSSEDRIARHSRIRKKVKRKIDLVYGGGSVGLMGLTSRRVYEGGFHVLGIIPKALMPTEISGETVGDVRVVADMYERKAAMAQEAEAFISLPGGYGTMEELLEMITWSQLGIHKKTVGLLNVDGYYNNLLALFDTGVEEGFIKPGARNIVVSAPTAKELMEKMEEYTPSHKHVASHESWKVEELGDYPGQENKPQ